MKKKVIFLTVLFGLFLFIVKPAYGQMMWNSNTPNATPTQQDLQDIQTGQDLYSKLKNKQITCSELNDDDFEKIGEYVMDKQFSNTQQHIQMNERAKQMMGENGEEQMHIRIGRNAANCNSGNQGGGTNMMGWGNYGFNGIMGWNNSISFVPLLIEVFILIDLILLGIWLWKRVRK